MGGDRVNWSSTTSLGISSIQHPASNSALRVELQKPRHHPVRVDRGPEPANDLLELFLVTTDVVVKIDQQSLPEAFFVELGVELGAVDGFVAVPDGLVARQGRMGQFPPAGAENPEPKDKNFTASAVNDDPKRAAADTVSA